MKSIIYKCKQITTGFTLVEALVAVTLLMFAAIGPLLLIDSSLRSAYETKDRTIAAFLALEGMEAVRAVRDHHSLSNPRRLDSIDWLGSVASLRQCVGQNCVIDIDSAGIPEVLPCAGACPPLRESSVRGYSYNGADPVSSFTRYFSIEELPNLPNYHATTTIVVSWTTAAGRTRSLTYEYHIFNW